MQQGDIHERISTALEVATKGLGMDIGILSYIHDNTYTVKYVYAPGVDLPPGTSFQLNDTYCSITLMTDGVFSVNHMQESAYAQHPCYNLFNLESYLGAAICVADELYGTINFSSVKPREVAFTQDDEDLILMLARWVGAKLQLQASIAKQQESEARYKLLTESAFESIVILDNGVIREVNDNFCLLFGYDRQVVIGMSAIKLVHESDAERVRQKIIRGDERTYEAKALRQDNSTFIAEVRGKQLPSGLRVTVIQDITERKRYEEKLRHAALHDALTGLYNRTAFTQALKNACEQSKRYTSYGFAVLFIDFDRFKLVNDSLGHHIGDLLLIAIAERLVKSLRSTDTVARLGGDEFTVLLDNMRSPEQARVTVQKLQDAFNTPFMLGEHTLFISASIGVAMHDSSPEHPEYLIRNADAAMYHAKALGKAQFAFFTQALRQKTLTSLKVEKSLRQAVENQEFVLFYQPIVNLSSGVVEGFEALLRWPQPDGSFITPDEFIPVLEETGLIVPVGKWVLQEAISRLHEWRLAGNSTLKMSVNVSARQFLQPDFDKLVKTVLEENAVPAAQLCLEITESMLMLSPEHAVQMMQKLKILGTELHVDDFGTGYSSLSYLHQFPLDVIKIDRSFVHDMQQNNSSAKIVDTLMSLAKNLNMHTIAEGIELNEHVTALTALDCQSGQGYLFSKPLPAKHVPDLLNA